MDDWFCLCLCSHAGLWRSATEKSGCTFETFGLRAVAVEVVGKGHRKRAVGKQGVGKVLLLQGIKVTTHLLAAGTGGEEEQQEEADATWYRTSL